MPGSCTSKTIVHQIGLTSQTADFATPHEWVAARHGNLLTRVLLSVSRDEGEFLPGELLMGSLSMCTGTFVDDGRHEKSSLTLDAPSQTCVVGETLRGSTSGIEVEVLGYLAEGVIERGEMRAGTYFNQRSLVFHDEDGVTDGEHYMWLTSTTDDRHFGDEGVGAVIDGTQLIGGENFIIRVDLPFTRLEWLEVANAQGAKTMLQVAADGVFMQHMIFHAGNSNAVIATDLGGSRSPLLWIANSIFYDLGRWAITATGSRSTIRVANTTTYACAKVENNPADDGCVGVKEGGELEAFNSAVMASLDGDTVGGDFYVQNGAGTILGTSSHNASSDMSAPGSQPVELLLDSEITFADRVSPDLRPAGSSRLRSAGTTLAEGWPFDISLDLSGDARTGTWNIGAF